MFGKVDIIMTKTINWINLVRAFCIFAVFFVHCENYYGSRIVLVDSVVRPFYVNAFFFVSGYLLLRKQLSEPTVDEKFSQYVHDGGCKQLLNIFFRIVVPSILFSLIEYFPKKVIQGGSLEVRPFLYETIGGCTYWFTSALVVAEILFVLLFLTRCRNVWLYFILAIIFACFGDYLATNNLNIVSDSVAFPWQYKQGLICMVYVAAGGVYWRYEDSIHRLLKDNWILLLLIVAYSVLAICFYSYLAKGYLVSMCLTHPVGVVFGIFASLLLVELCKKLSEMKPLTFIGQNTIGFYFMSGALPIVLSMTVHRFLHGSSLLGLTIVFFGSCIIGFVAVYLMNRFAPWLFDLRVLKKKQKKQTWY